MASLFGGKTLTLPKREVVRMPNETDPDSIAVGKLAREKAAKKMGRQSTLLTDALRSGSTGKTLGA